MGVRPIHLSRWWRVVYLLPFLGYITLASPGQEAKKQETAEGPNYYAVVIGVSQFQHLNKDQWWLNFADADASGFANVIKSPRGRAFPEDHVSLLTNDTATLMSIKTRLGLSLPRELKTDDIVYIFVATHGVVENEAGKEAYLLTYDSDPEGYYTTALPMDELGRIIQGRLLKAQRVLLFADACRAARYGQAQNMIRGYLAGKERGALLASRPSEASTEGKQWGHGVFTYYLLKGLMGEADKDHDNTVTWNELTTYTYENVKTATGDKQHVHDEGDISGDTPLAYVDKPGPSGLKLSAAPRVFARELASLTFMIPDDRDERVRAAFQRELKDGHLIAPPGSNAWESFQTYRQLPVPEFSKSVLQDDLVIALADAGEKVLARYRRGDQLAPLAASEYANAGEMFSIASTLSPEDVTLQAKARFLNGRAQVASGRYEEAIPLLRQAVQLDPKSAYSYNALGIAYMQQERWADATQNFRAASERATKWVYPVANLARVLVAQKRYTEAINEYKRGIQVSADLGLQYSYLYFNLGQIYRLQKKLDLAEQQFRQAAQTNPADAQSLYYLGLLAQEQHRDRDAEDFFRKASAADPSFGEAAVKTAEILHQRGQHDEEEAVLRKSASGAAPSPVVLEVLGLTLLKHKKPADAEAVFIQLLQRNPVAAYAGLGQAAEQRGDYKMAAEHYRQALSQAADPRQQRELQQKLDAAERRK